MQLSGCRTYRAGGSCIRKPVKSLDWKFLPVVYVCVRWGRGGREKERGQYIRLREKGRVVLVEDNYIMQT